MSKVRKRNLETSEVIKVDLDIERKPISKDIISESIKTVDTDVTGISFILFHLEFISSKYDISYEYVIILLYLYDLKIFTMTIEVHERQIALYQYVVNDLITDDYSVNNNKLYKLTDKGNGIVEEFRKVMKNDKSVMLKNRNTDIDLDSKAKSVLSSFFK